MISQLYIKNFKSLKEIDLEIRHLNLLTGLNGSGKSSLIQTLLLLRQSPEIGKGELKLDNPSNTLFDAGVAEDVYYQFGTDKEIVFRCVSEQHCLEWFFDCDVLSHPNRDVLRASADYSPEQLQQCNVFSSAFQYLSAERAGAQNAYPASVEVVKNQKSLGLSGEYTTHFLHVYGDYEVNEILHHPHARSNKLIHQTEAWLSELATGVRLKTEEISNEEVRLDFQFDTDQGITHKFKPKNVGLGLIYVLPVIVSLLSAEKDKLILIENPESHIHPRGQVELGKLFAAAAQSGVQLFIETHSDHILNGIRIATREKCIASENVISFYFKRFEEDNRSDITSILIDDKGKLHRKTAEGTVAKIPKGFFDEWTKSMLKLF
ncbi:MAG: DUF3696 domain-containing protein [Candidatus Parabeggiatoa sp. nov. 3]|nr:MAG: DUF3696 domain-containing protein [Gammaproteobacteria bacterium]RKZ61202.1 MAG: DUF3696 domain-containing protein [Gammaproteobacteria bacterium]RKZ84070.1 MAG: DUF3696 domain-containing protein [Gammaproteobacteria bacterium]